MLHVFPFYEGCGDDVREVGELLLDLIICFCVFSDSGDVHGEIVIANYIRSGSLACFGILNEC